MDESVGAAAKAKVLVVDDNRDTALSLAILLRHAGYEVRVAYDGPSALEAAKEYRPDCILSDIGLPKIDGYQLARMLREDDAFKSTPLIAISAYSDEEKAKAAGFDRLLVKPALPSVIIGLVKNLKIMHKSIQQSEELIRQQGQVVEQVKDLVTEVKQDVKEIKEGLKEEVKELKQTLSEVKEEVKEIKAELREAKEGPVRNLVSASRNW